MTASPADGLPEAVLRPVRGHHAFEACVEQLATAIRLGVYPLGTVLPAERELAERLAVSRATLREAMAALREAGLVETTRGRGGGTVVTLKPRLPNARKAARLARTYDELEARIAALAQAEELAAIRTELDGEQIMATLGLRPGPLVGRAYQHLLQVRLDQGPIGEDAARAELLRWWAEQSEATTP